MAPAGLHSVTRGWLHRRLALRSVGRRSSVLFIASIVWIAVLPVAASVSLAAGIVLVCAGAAVGLVGLPAVALLVVWRRTSDLRVRGVGRLTARLPEQHQADPEVSLSASRGGTVARKAVVVSDMSGDSIDEGKGAVLTTAPRWPYTNTRLEGRTPSRCARRDCPRRDIASKLAVGAAGGCHRQAAARLDTPAEPLEDLQLARLTSSRHGRALTVQHGPVLTRSPRPDAHMSRRRACG